jgi:arylsulfatase A-like enzyme
MADQVEHIPAAGPGTYARWSDTSGYQFCSCGQWHFVSKPAPTETPGEEP